MGIQLPYDGIGGTLNPDDWKELQRRLEGIEGNFNELTSIVDKPTINRRSVVSTSESTSSASYTKLTTVDQVNNVHLPEGALLVVVYRAVWKSSVASAGQAAIFLNENQLKVTESSLADPFVQFSSTETANTDQVLFTQPFGLYTYSAPDPSAPYVPVAYTNDVTTGQVVGARTINFFWRDSANGDGTGTTTKTGNYGQGGSPCHIFADPGTYSVSIRFKASSGSVTVRDRKLWVWVINF